MCILWPGFQMTPGLIRGRVCVFVSCFSYCSLGGFQMGYGGSEKSIYKILKLEVYNYLNMVMIRVPKRYIMRDYNSGTCQGLAI